MNDKTPQTPVTNTWAGETNQPAAPRPAYSIVDVDVRDPQAFAEYVRGHGATVTRFGGRFLVTTDQCQVVEGEWVPKRIVVHQWPSVEAFKAWYDSKEYRPWRDLRHQAAVTNVVLVEGV